MIAVGSSVLLASKAIPNANSPALQSIAAASIVDQIATELYSAISVAENSSTAIEFTVERDGQQHTIRYEWSGNPGDPLTRQYDGSAAVNVIDSAEEFNLAYDVKSSQQQLPGQTEGPEQLFNSYDGTSATSAKQIDSDEWSGQYFNPSLPADALSWRVTRVRFKARKSGNPNGQTLVQLRPANPFNLPTPIVLEQQVMHESTLSNSMTWQEFTFNDVAGLPPGQGLCLVLSYGAGAAIVAEVEIDGAGSDYIETINAGANWLYHSDQSLQHYIYGKITTDTTPPPPSDSRILSVTITLNAGSEPASRVRTGALVLNQPDYVSGL